MPFDNTALLACVTPLIQREESCRLYAYKDSKGIWTIAWGRADAGVHPGMTCTQAEADSWLLAKINAVISGLDGCLSWWRTLSIPRQAVLVEMAYQMGLHGLIEFHRTLTAIEDAQWQAAHDGMMASHWGLTDSPARAQREATQMLTGQVAA